MYRGGIGGIEKKIKDKEAVTDKHINEAFQDMTKLVDMAKDMSALSRNIAQRLKDKGSNISDDETILFKSHLLSLGVTDPVTRESFGSDSKYYQELARQIAQIIIPIALESGGQIALTDAYCTVNRARGIELISTDDLLNACRIFASQNLGIKLVKYPSGLMVLQCDKYDEKEINEKTLQVISSLGSISAHELAVQIGVSVSLARQRLLDCERGGLACRDESIQGLRFFTNRFLMET